MFHLFIGLISAGAMALVIGIMLIPLWLGALVQAAVALFSKGRVARFVPLALGAVGLAVSLWSLCISSQTFPWWAILIYWLIYVLLLWAADAVARRIRAWISAKRASRT